MLCQMHQVLGERPLPQLAPEQQAALAASRRERRLDEIVGLPAQPPEAPTGSYVELDQCLLTADPKQHSLESNPQLWQRMGLCRGLPVWRSGQWQVPDCRNVLRLR
jgi:hypothetical protein